MQTQGINKALFCKRANRKDANKFTILIDDKLKNVITKQSFWRDIANDPIMLVWQIKSKKIHWIRFEHLATAKQVSKLEEEEK